MFEICDPQCHIRPTIVIIFETSCNRLEQVKKFSNQIRQNSIADVVFSAFGLPESEAAHSDFGGSAFVGKTRVPSNLTEL